MRPWIGIIALLCSAGAWAAPKIAVTDLAYEARVEEYIHAVAASHNFQASPYNASGASSYAEFESRNSYIEQSELRKFSGDIKGEILKSRQFQLVQGTPYTREA
ncbi:penicillin-binding protein activator LpoB, partial [Pseudomonas syringae]|nr:penicillin-binding protein activator LpoB [Pseudomonas syringae]